MTFDRRLFAFRPDVAEEALRGQIEAERFSQGQLVRTIERKTAMRLQPDRRSAIDTELLFGEDAVVYDRSDGWAWAKSKLDGYVGYIEESALAVVDVPITHWVVAPRTFLYPEPDMKLPQLDVLSMGSRLSVIGEAETRGTHYLLTKQGALIASHLQKIDEPAAADHVAIAARLLETPYLWGGRSCLGLDCSGLIQLTLMMTGKQVLRDADMQEASIGIEIDRSELQRGDLVFWRGHVAMMEDEGTMIHANGYSMSVSRERLGAAILRIASTYGQPRTFRRP